MRRQLAILALAAAMRCAAATPGVTLIGPSLSPSLNSIVVAVGKPRPPLDSIQASNLWQVAARQPGNPLGVLVPVASVDQADSDLPYAVTGLVRVTFAAPLATVPDTIDLTLALGTHPATVTWKNKKPGAKPTQFQDPFGFYPAANKASADMYLSGAYVGGVGAKPAYEVDAVVGSPVWIPGHVPAGAEVDKRQYVVSVTGKAATTDKPSFDPDSFSAGVSLARRYPKALDDHGRSYFDFKWNAADWEFSRVDKAFNFVSTPTLIYDVGGAVLRADRTVAAAASLDFYGGVEVGTNLENKIVAGGYGGIARFVPGAALNLVFPKALGLKSISFTSDYRDRILGEKEPFIDTRGKTRTYLARGSRHHISNTLTLQLSDYVGISIKHEYGSLPPAFKLVDNKVTIGVTTLWSWKKKGG